MKLARVSGLLLVVPLAQGAIYYDVVSRTQGGEIKELHIGVFYTTMERSTVSIARHKTFPQKK